MDGGILRQREPVLDSVYVSHFFAMLTLTGLNPFILWIAAGHSCTAPSISRKQSALVGVARIA